MKTYLIIIVLFLSFDKAHAQPKLPNWYASGYIGTMLYADELPGTVNISAGYQFNKWLGLGLSRGLYSDGKLSAGTFSGIGLEYRLVNPRKWIWSFTGGMGFKHSKNNDSCGEYRTGEEHFPYFKIHVGRRIGSIFTIGATFWQGSVKMEYWGCELSTPDVYIYKGLEKIQMMSAVITLGFNIH